MPFIGNTPQTQSFAPAIDYFSGNGVTVTFTLSRPVVSVAQLTVAVDNVIQNPSSAFTVSGNSITFTSAPLSGTNNIWVEYTSLITTYAAISQDPSVIGDISATGGYLAEGDFGNSYIDGTVVDYVTGNARITTGPIDNMTFYHGGTSGRSEMMELYYAGGAKIFGTTALTIPVGTTAQRPTGATGMIRMNSTTGYPEWYSATASAWIQFNQGVPYSVEYLVIAGGGGGATGGNAGGGGGAGGYRSSVTGESSGGGASAEAALSVNPDQAYTVTVGAGGAGGSGVVGTNGSNSVFGSITSTGGGGGGYTGAGVSGGSGGGGGSIGDNTFKAGGSGTAGQGYAGGQGAHFPGVWEGGGGGGGAGAVGTNGAKIEPSGPGQAGAGGAGVASSITGSSVTRGGGGGGGGNNGGAGGSGGGGAGVNPGTGGAGTANTGGGGGGSNGGTGGAGGSGIVIIRYLGAQRGTGGTVTSAGGYTIHTFTSSGTYTA